MHKKKSPILFLHPASKRTLFEFESIAEAAQKFNVTNSAITSASSKGRLFKGYLVMRKEIYEKAGGYVSVNTQMSKTVH